MSRKRESGCEYRKRAKERSEKNEELVKKIPKIDTFLQKGDKKQKVDSTELSEIQQEFDQPSTSGNNTSNKAESIMEIPEQVESCENPKKAFPEISGSSDNFSDDPALWDEITEELRQNFINRGIKQNIDLLDFEASRRNYNDRVRYCSKGLFKTRLKNAETHTRDFLIYSASTGRLYCLPCRLFNGKGPFASTGFNDWKNPITIEQHENSQNHKNCVLILLQRQKAAGQVDALHVKEYKREVQYWREVLKRVVAAIKALASRGLSFRGSTEVFGSLHNGNYMMLLEFLAEFDPFLADHIEKHGNQGRGNVSYLSSSICEEIIQIMATEVLKSIDQEVTEAKYYSISVDSTPDITHTDQLAFITRYNKEDGKPVERFLGKIEKSCIFFLMFSHLPILK